jgi:hypothetical protein
MQRMAFVDTPIFWEVLRDLHPLMEAPPLAVQAAVEIEPKAIVDLRPRKRSRTRREPARPVRVGPAKRLDKEEEL